MVLLVAAVAVTGGLHPAVAAVTASVCAITVQSPVGVGTSVDVELPLDP
jgi:hypothetical protein